MAFNFPGPYELRLFYTLTISSVALVHQARYNIDLAAPPTPGDAFSTMTVKTKDGTNPTLAFFASGWAALFKAALSSNAGCTVDYYELWKIEPESFDASYISTESVAAAGTSGSATIPAQQSIMTFRTALGGVLKINVLEGIAAAVGRDTAPFSTAALEAMRAAVIGGGNPFLGRDGSYPFASIAHFSGTNEAVFKRRFRS